MLVQNLGRSLPLPSRSTVLTRMSEGKRSIHSPSSAPRKRNDQRGNAWKRALLEYATGSAQSIGSALLTCDQHTVSIYDCFPKAKYHFLILPRLPYILPHNDALIPTESPQLATSHGQLNLGVSSKSNRVPGSHLDSISTLLASPYAPHVIASLRTACDKTVELVKQKMRSEYHGFTWDIQAGFHCVPSMHHLHLHVISTDFISDRMKTKHHYQSFHPTHGFFLPLSTVESYLQDSRKSLPHPKSYYESLLKAPMISFHNHQPFFQMPQLKAHLQDVWNSRMLLSSSTSQTEISKSSSRQSSESPVLGATIPATTSTTTISAPVGVISPSSNRKSLPQGPPISDSETEPETELPT